MHYFENENSTHVYGMCKDRLNSDANQFHKINKIIASHLNLNTNKTTTYDFGNTCPDLAQAQKCGGCLVFYHSFQKNCRVYLTYWGYKHRVDITNWSVKTPDNTWGWFGTNTHVNDVNNGAVCWSFYFILFFITIKSF